MAKDDEDHLPVVSEDGENGNALRGTDKKDGKDSDALDEQRLRTNPEILKAIELPGLDDLEVFVVQPARPLWVRCVEHVSFHLVSAAVAAAIAFLVGLGIGGTEGAASKPQTPICDTQTPNLAE